MTDTPDAVVKNSRTIRQSRLTLIDQWGQVIGLVAIVLPLVSGAPRPVMYFGLGLCALLVVTTMWRARLIRRFRIEDHRAAKNRKPEDA